MEGVSSVVPDDLRIVTPLPRSVRGVIIPKKSKSDPMISWVSIGYILIIFGFLLYYGYGIAAESTYSERGLRSLLFCAPILVLAVLRPFYAMELFVASLLPLKILMEHGYITYSVIHILSIGMPILLLRLPLRNKQFEGKALFWFFFYVNAAQTLRSLELVIGVNNLLSLLGFLTVFYIAIPRFSLAQLRRIAFAYCLGNWAACCFIFLIHDWSLQQRMGESLLLNANSIATSTALCLILWAFLNLKNRPTIFTVLFYGVHGLTLFLTGSRTAILMASLTLIIYLGRKKSVVIFLACVTFALASYVPTLLELGGAGTEHLIKGLSTPDSGLEGLSNLRIQLFQRNMALLAESPLFGIGFSNAAEMAQIINPHNGEVLIPHNIFLSVAVELGLTGLIILMMWLSKVILKSHSLLASTLVGALLFVGLFHGNFLHPLFAVPWGLAILLGAPPPSPKMEHDAALHSPAST